MAIKLRPYQHQAVARMRSNIANGIRSQILHAPTGAGKTIMASFVMQSAVSKGRRCLFLAHRAELVEQCSAKLDQIGLDHGVIQAGHWRVKPNAPVQVASVQTLVRREKPPADLIIIDECHLAAANSYVKLLEAYQNAYVIGLTATPTRLDGRGLGHLFQTIVPTASVSQLIAEGFLVSPRVFAPSRPDLSDIQIRGGDFDKDQAEQAMLGSGITGDIVAHWLKLARGRKTILFAAGVRHSKALCESFRGAGVRAEHLDGNTDKHIRSKTLDRWRTGEFEVLCNANLFIEGLDVPEAACCILARPTRSVTVYLQSVGRVMRPAPGKTDCIILDHAGLTYLHGLIDDEREWSLEGSAKQRKRKTEEKAPTVAVCQRCFAAFNPAENAGRCPNCGEVLPVRQRRVGVRDGELEELTPEKMAALRREKRREVAQAITIDELIAIGKKRGYRYPVQWARHVMKHRNRRNIDDSSGYV